MPVYDIRPKINENLRLNVSGQGVAQDRQNVTVYSSTGSNDQKWFVHTVGEKQQKILTTINQAFGLNVVGPSSTTTRNCTLLVVGGNDTDSSVDFEWAGDGCWYLKLSNYEYYLTAEGSTSGSNVSWQPFNGGDAQIWRFTPAVAAGPQNYTYMTATYDGVVLHIIRTSSGNIKLHNLLYTKNLQEAGVIGINGGFYAQGNKLLNIAKSDGAYVGTGTAPYNGKANSCGSGVIYRKADGTMYFAEGKNVDDDESLSEVKELTGTVSWAQGGAGIYPGYSKWRDENLAFFVDMDKENPTACRSAMVVDFERDFVYLIITRNSVAYSKFRSAIMKLLNVTDTSDTDKYILSDRYAGVFLDGGGSSQLRAVSPQNSSVLIPQNGRNMMQIIILRNVT